MNNDYESAGRHFSAFRVDLFLVGAAVVLADDPLELPNTKDAEKGAVFLLCC